MTVADRSVSIVVAGAEDRDRVCAALAGADLEVATFATGEAFLDAYDPATPGCAILDLDLPGLSGLEVQRQLAAASAVTSVVFMAAAASVAAVVQMFKGGAFDFIATPIDPGYQRQQVQAALLRSVQTWEQRRRQNEARHRLHRLTPRERELLQLVVAGKSTKQIAAELGISERTAAHHREHLASKSAADNTASLVRLAVLAGMD